MSIFKTYRDANTGIVREYPTSLANSFPNLIEVDCDAPCSTCTAPDEAPVDLPYSVADLARGDNETPDAEEEDDDE